LDTDTLHPPANVAKMAAGEPLSDDDRNPWLERVGDWLAGHPAGVVSCSALKRKYRDQLRAHCARVEFLHLDGSAETIGRRLAARSGHFMPAALLRRSWRRWNLSASTSRVSPSMSVTASTPSSPLSWRASA